MSVKDMIVDAKPAVDREKTVPFLMRTFVKTDGGFHRPTLFEDGMAPTTDEYQVHTWRDATLQEVINVLRLQTASAELKHPLAKFAFRAVYADASARGRVATRDLGSVSARDLLGPSGTLDSPAPRLITDEDEDEAVIIDERKSVFGKSLEELRFIPGDFLCVSVQLPKHLSQHGDVAIRGAAAGAGPMGANGWKSSRPLEPQGPPGGLGRGGGHWRGGSEPNAGRGRSGRGERPRRDFERDQYFDDRERRPLPPRRIRDSPTREPYDGRRSRSHSRSLSPRRRRYRV